MIEVNANTMPGIQEAVTQGLKIVLVPSAESLPRSLSRYSHYECLGLDDDGDLKIRYDDGDTGAICVRSAEKFGFRATDRDGELTEESLQALISKKNQRVAESLRMAHEVFSQKHTFEEGQLIQFKPGMKDRKAPEVGQPAVVMEVIPELLKDPEAGFGNHYATSQYDMIIGVFLKGDFIQFYADSRRYEPFVA